jgi:TolB-like protein/DNA-binding SARP family transcriptional activator/Tfp pilus assembly protein PilF
MPRLKTFGELVIQSDADHVVGVAGQRRSLALLALLAAAGSRGTSRERLTLLLWPEVQPEKAGHRLAQALYALRRELGEGLLDRDSYKPLLDSRVLPSDVAEFQEALERGELERAAGLYAGPFLEGFYLSEAPEFDRWLEEERARLRGEYVDALIKLAGQAEGRGDRLKAVEWWRRLAQTDRLSPRVALGYMQALVRTGERINALHYARVYTGLLREELDAAPDPAVRAFMLRLKLEDEDQGPETGTTTAPPAHPEAQRIAGRYLVEKVVSTGPNASVYFARDLKHARSVAVKVFANSLDTELTGRIAAAADLHHPHILPLYDAGSTDCGLFCVMPPIRGGSLRAHIDREGPLPVDEALRVVEEAAGALDYAHRRGVLHGNVSPENILLEDGHPLLSDFGLHLLSATRKADIHALASILYETLTGQPPGSDENQVTSARTLRRSIPRGIDIALERALAPNSADRFASAADFVAALSASRKNGLRSGVPTNQERSIAVLPFMNLTGGEENEYFSEGMTEELINALVKVPGLRVASRTSSFAFKGKDLDIRSIGERLGARTLVEGSVRRMGDQLRVTAQLVESQDGYHIWSETYDRHMVDVFAIQQEIAETIASTLRLRLADDRQLVRPGTRDLAVYTTYLKGRYFWNQRTPEGLRRSLEYYERAVRDGPTFALAYTGLADAYHTCAVYGILRPVDCYPKARAAAERALALDPSLPEGHTSLAHVAFVHDLDHQAAERSYIQALELNPLYVPARHWYAWLLTVLGRHEEAIEQARRAVELEPLSILVLTRGGDILSYAGQFDEAAGLCERALELEPSSFGALEVVALNAARRGDPGRALAAIEVLGSFPGNQLACMVPWLLAAAGEQEKARSLLAGLNLSPDSPTVPTGYMAAWLAAAYADIGEYELAFRWADRLIAERSFSIQFWQVDSGFKRLRADPRYLRISRQLGLA